MAACSWAAFAWAIACTLEFVEYWRFARSERHPHYEYLILGVLGLITSFALARCLVGLSKSWTTFRFSQWLALPPLIVGYVFLSLVLLLWPLMTVTALGLAPMYADVPAQDWKMFNEHFPEQDGAKFGKYWLKVNGWGAAASAAWSVALVWTLRRRSSTRVVPRSSYNTGSALAEALHRWPQTFPALFHPASAEAFHIGTMYAVVLVELMLGRDATFMTSDRKKPGVAFWVTVVVVALPILYVVSFGPACWWCSGPPDGFDFGIPWPFAPRIYWPLGWLSAKCDPDNPVRIAINWYATRRSEVVMLPYHWDGSAWHSSN